MSKLAAIVLLPFLLVGGAAAGALMSDALLLVDVREADGPRIVVPVPLSLARAGMWFAPEDLRRLDAPEFGRALPHAEGLLAALREAPDGELVEILDGEDRVRVSKAGDALLVRVTEGRDQRVDVDLPLGSVAAALRAYDTEAGAFRTSALVSALEEAPRGPLVHVLDGGDQVRVRMLW